ncbi:peptidylprolyl isomerase [Aggregatimonas sangjinii]|uniref:Periplasmic chaperone PpiD n=1 Tax=Aggregatimonas sangjinii TaxID=2583587 RepID=A0A5B7SJH8_9FLAO|nr:peptidylprolyl isomerase [Aggregatimonas sangjinii]QCW98715.1 peptidylprolyl isomerase [Aggregatimonas sangjinii]
MAILENIRKRTTVLILIIGLALFAFVISGVFTADGLSGQKVGSTVAEINGEEIPIDAFRQKVDNQQRNSAPGTSTMQVVNQVYDQEVKNAILGQQFEDLGVNIEEDQIINFLKTTGYAQSPEFQNSNGVFDENVFRNAVASWKASEPLRYDSWLQTEKAIIQAAKEQTYYNLIKAGVGATLKEGELDYRLANEKMDIKYVRVPYTSIPDSTVTVTKEEIAAYIDAHKDEYEQEEARDIQFVYFEEKPSETDVKAVEDEIAKLLDDTVEYNSNTSQNDTISGFRNATDIAAFIDRHSDIKFDTIYKPKNQLSPLYADTLMTLQPGEMYGPYRDGDYFKVSKMVARKPNGSVKASHILLGYEGAQSANPDVKRTKEEAEARAKELLRTAKKGDTTFIELARKHSDGPSAANGGDLGYFQEGAMVPTFNDFAFGNPKDAVGMVETDFGFHVIKIDDKQDIVQIATLAREVETSEETSNKLFTDATNFELQSIETETPFSDFAKEKEYTIRPVNKIKAMDENLPGLSAQRNIVQWAFNPETELGEIKRFNINNGYAVAQLTGVYEKGVMGVEDASASVLPKIRKERKAAQIIGANQGKSLEDFAKDNNVSVSNASALTVKSPTIPGAGSEPAVVGTAFAMNEGDTSGLIEGSTGVFMLTVTKKEAPVPLENYSTYANAIKTANVGKVNTAVYQALKENATIEDKRKTFY